MDILAFINIFNYSFMIKAIIIGSCLALILPLIGLPIVLKRISTVGDTLSHSSLAGVSIGLVFGFNPLLGAIVFCIIASLSMEYIRNKLKSFHEISNVLILSISVGIAGILTSFMHNTNSVNTYLFGSLLTINNFEFYLVILLSFVVILIYLIIYKKLFLTLFDSESAKYMGIKVKNINFLFAFLSAITVSISAKAIGFLIVSSLLVIPSIIAMQLGKTYKKVLIISIVSSILFTNIGLLLSYELDLKPGSVIVLLASISLIFCILFKKNIIIFIRFIKKLKMKNMMIIFICSLCFSLVSCNFEENKTNITKKLDIIEDETTEILNSDILFDKDSIVSFYKHGDHWHVLLKDGNEVIVYKDPSNPDNFKDIIEAKPIEKYSIEKIIENTEYIFEVNGNYYMHWLHVNHYHDDPIFSLDGIIFKEAPPDFDCNDSNEIQSKVTNKKFYKNKNIIYFKNTFNDINNDELNNQNEIKISYEKDVKGNIISIYQKNNLIFVEWRHVDHIHNDSIDIYDYLKIKKLPKNVDKSKLKKIDTNLIGISYYEGNEAIYYISEQQVFDNVEFQKGKYKVEYNGKEYIISQKLLDISIKEGDFLPNPSEDSNSNINIGYRFDKERHIILDSKLIKKGFEPWATYVDINNEEILNETDKFKWFICQKDSDRFKEINVKSKQGLEINKQDYLFSLEDDGGLLKVQVVDENNKIKDQVIYDITVINDTSELVVSDKTKEVIKNTKKLMYHDDFLKIKWWHVNHWHYEPVVYYQDLLIKKAEDNFIPKKENQIRELSLDERMLDKVYYLEEDKIIYKEVSRTTFINLKIEEIISRINMYNKSLKNDNVSQEYEYSRDEQLYEINKVLELYNNLDEKNKENINNINYLIENLKL